MLCHAELESYLEEWAKELAKAAESAWQKKRKVTGPLAFLLASIADRISEADSTSTKNAKDAHQKFADIVSDLFQEYYRRIGDNNGIKERNVLRLFDPIGVEWTAFSPTLLPNLNSLGSARGKHAHYSRRAVKNVLDPLDEYNRLKTIVAELGQLEIWLVRYRRSIR